MKTPYRSYKDRLDEIFTKYADSDAIVYLAESGKKIHRTFSQLSHIIENWSAALSSCRIETGDRVAVIAPLAPSTVTAGLTLAYANVTAVLLDASLPAEELNRLLAFSDVQGVFTTGDFFPKIRDKNIPIFDLDCSDLQLVQFDPRVRPAGKAHQAERDPEVAAIIYSSGTTSSTKGVMYTYESILQSWEKLAYSFGLTPGVRYFMVLPFNHISGYISAAAFLLSGDTLCLMENLTPARLQKGLLEFNPHYFAMVPKVYDIMADKIRDAIRQKGPAVEKAMEIGFRLSGFLRKNFGLKIGKVLFRPIYQRALGKNITGLAILGTICRAETAQLFLAFGLEWANLYATTETNAPITTTGVFDRYPMHSVGKINRFPDIDIVVNAPNQEGVGEIYVKTPLIMKGYFREPELTAAAFAGEYFKTGDLGYVDRDGYLYLTGRSKDTIVLHSGKKVSAVDIDEFYQQICPDIAVASCGISGSEGFDTVHLFLETHGQTQGAIDQAREWIAARSAEAGSLYQIAAIHEIQYLPVTSIGKVKRFVLKEIAENAAPTETPVLPEQSGDVLQTVCRLASSVSKIVRDITPGSQLRKDLGLDSLDVFELCAALEEELGVSVEAQLHDGITVGEIAALIEQNTPTAQRSEFCGSYPLPKTEKDMRAFRTFMTISKALWKFEISGLEHLRPGKKYIFCPNHETYLDALWVTGSLDEASQRAMCSLAADRLFENKLFLRGLTVAGGIPVQRSGNTAPALKRAYECLASGERHLLVHPEGTRTRTGELGRFKNGAARLSIESGVSIVPVCLSGAYEIFPPQRRLPKLFDWKRLRRYPLRITFGTPIKPEGRSAEEITREIEAQMIAMKKQEGGL